MSDDEIECIVEGGTEPTVALPRRLAVAFNADVRLTAVEGVALIGSLGRREADNWSDTDLLILMGGEALARFMGEPAACPWARADLLVDARHNSPSGATSVGTTHIRSGLPFHVDLHAHPAGQALWPADSRIVFERRSIKKGILSFDEVNASGSRQSPTAKTADGRRVRVK